jgi:recombination protein RecA
VLDAAVDRKIVQKSGSYFSFGDERLGQGRQNAAAFLGEHSDVTQQILGAIQDLIGDEQIVSARLGEKPREAPIVAVVEEEAEEVVTAA